MMLSLAVRSESLIWTEHALQTNPHLLKLLRSGYDGEPRSDATLTSIRRKRYSATIGGNPVTYNSKALAQLSRLCSGARDAEIDTNLSFPVASQRVRAKMTYLRTLRLSFGDTFQECRLNQDRVEFRNSDGCWRALDEDDVQLHFMLHTEVSKWLMRASASMPRTKSPA